MVFLSLLCTSWESEACTAEYYHGAELPAYCHSSVFPCIFSFCNLRSVALNELRRAVGAAATRRCSKRVAEWRRGGSQRLNETANTSLDHSHRHVLCTQVSSWLRLQLQPRLNIRGLTFSSKQKVIVTVSANIHLRPGSAPLADVFLYLLCLLE